MRTIQVKNLSTLLDCAAVYRVHRFMIGEVYAATHDKRGKEIVKITRRGDTYTVVDTDMEEWHE